MSDANRVSIMVIPEATYGVTPPNATTWQDMRYMSSSMAAKPRTAISKEIRSDRQVSDLILVGQEVSGDMGIELSAGTYDILLAQAMMQTDWVSNVLKVGTTKRSLSMEIAMQDWGTIHYLQYKGVRVGGFNMKFAWGSPVEGAFMFAGKEALESATSLKGTGTIIAATTTDVMNGSSGIGTILFDGVAPTSGTIIKSVSLNLNNGLRAIEGIGSVGPSDQVAGRAMITGSVEAYFDNPQLYQKLVNNTAMALSFVVTQGAKSYTFRLPKIKFNDGVPAVTGIDTDNMLTLGFTALYDATDSALKITRVP